MGTTYETSMVTFVQKLLKQNGRWPDLSQCAGGGAPCRCHGDAAVGGAAGRGHHLPVARLPGAEPAGLRPPGPQVSGPSGAAPQSGLVHRSVPSDSGQIFFLDRWFSNGGS